MNNSENHEIRPVKDSWYTKGGLPADLFRSSDYPIEAVCVSCSRPIVAQSFLRPFEHVEGAGKAVEPRWEHFERE